MCVKKMWSVCDCSMKHTILVVCQLNCDIACGASCNSDTYVLLFFFFYLFLTFNQICTTLPLSITRRVTFVISPVSSSSLSNILWTSWSLFVCLYDVHSSFRWITLNWSFVPYCIFNICFWFVFILDLFFHEVTILCWSESVISLIPFNTQNCWKREKKTPAGSVVVD